MPTEQTDILAEFPHLREAALLVSKLIRDARSHMSPAGTALDSRRTWLEIEARLGREGNSGFEANIGNQAFASLLQLLESYPRWIRVVPWTESQDVFFDVDLPPLSRGGEYMSGSEITTEVRTTAGPNADNEFEVKHVIKRRLHMADLYVTALDAGSCSIALPKDELQMKLDARVTANLECVVPAELLPIAVVPKRIRIKQRKKFILGSLGVDKETFSFDMSICYSGITKTEAEQNQMCNLDPTYEVEVECLCPSEYLNSCADDETYLALSLLLKLHDFVAALNPQSTVTFQPKASKRRSCASSNTTGICLRAQ